LLAHGSVSQSPARIYFLSMHTWVAQHRRWLFSARRSTIPAAAPRSVPDWGKLSVPDSGKLSGYWYMHGSRAANLWTRETCPAYL
jgi:hypothetical protein